MCCAISPPYPFFTRKKISADLLSRMSLLLFTPENKCLYPENHFHMISVHFINRKSFVALQKNPTHVHSLTYLCRIDGDHRAEGTLSFAVVSSNLDMKWRERRDAFVAVHVARRARGRGGHVSPANFSEGAESNDVTKALTILQFFGDRLRVKHKTIVILKHIQTSHVHPTTGLKQSPPTLSCCQKKCTTYKLLLWPTWWNEMSTKMPFKKKKKKSKLITESLCSF